MAVLHPVTFGARCCHRNEVWLNSHLGEGFSGDWVINKYHHMLFGQCFVWTTDCYATKFILSYNGANPAILHLQMHMMCWDGDIVHWNDHYIADADYWSWLGMDLCFDPLFKAYLELTQSLHLKNPPPSSFLMQPKNMPYYCWPRVTKQPDNTVDTTDAAHCQAIISTLFIDNCFGLCHLSNIPVTFGDFKKVTPQVARALHNDKFICYAQQVLQFSWAMYFFHGGHFCTNYPISKPARPRSNGMWPLWVQPITISGIHIMPSHLQQCYRPPKLHSCIWWHISNPWLFHPLSTFSNKWDNHYILANSGWNYLTTPSNTIVIDNYHHDPPRPWWP